MSANEETGVTLMRLYESLDVWKRISEKQLVRYRCFKDLASGQYSVQSADFYYLPFEPKQVADLERQHMELFAEQAPEERAGRFTSPEAAIEAHDKDFRSSEDGEDDDSSAGG